MENMNLKPLFEVRFTNIDEIRMGSPYNTCKIEIIGISNIKLPATAGWQDKYAWTPDFKQLVLIKWNTSNEPGFHFFIIDIESGESRESPKVLGLLNNLSIIGKNIFYNKFLFNAEKSMRGQLCCESDEIFELE